MSDPFTDPYPPCKGCGAAYEDCTLPPNSCVRNLRARVAELEAWLAGDAAAEDATLRQFGLFEEFSIFGCDAFHWICAALAHERSEVDRLKEAGIETEYPNGRKEVGEG